MYFRANQALLVKYDQGLLLRSSTYADLKAAKAAAERDNFYGTGVHWFPIDTPLDEPEPEPEPRRESFNNATVPRTHLKAYKKHVPLATPKGRLERIMRGTQTLNSISDKPTKEE
jgi:hypothetical protein